MADNELLIKINADAKNAEKAFDNIKKQTEDMEGQLNKTALVAGAAFAAFTAEIFISVNAFQEAEKASVRLVNSLQNQGIYTKQLADTYKQYAKNIQDKTGFDNDEIINAQAIAQTYLGQIQITEELTQSIVDLGASMGGDLSTAAMQISRTIGSNTNAFARQGLQISDTMTRAERYATVLDFVKTRAGGLAEEFNKADGYSRALTTSFGNLQEEIGKNFAPIVSFARQKLVEFFNFVNENPALVKAIVSFIAAGAAVTGIMTAAAALVPVMTSLTAAATALGISLNIAFLGIPLAIAAVVGGLTWLSLNWDKSLRYIISISQYFATLIIELWNGVGKVMAGAFTLDTKKLNAGITKIKESLSKANQAYATSYEEITKKQKEEEIKQDAEKEKAAKLRQAKEAQHQANLTAIQKAEAEKTKLINENASKELIDLKTKEIEILNDLDKQKTANELNELRTRYEQIKTLQAEQYNNDLQRRVDFEILKQQSLNELEAQGIETKNTLKAEELAALQAATKTEQDINNQVITEKVQKNIDSQNKMLLDKKKYGETVALLTKITGSDEVKGTKAAADELVQLQSSKNATLKSIGKAAAVAQITISTAESAMNIYKGFSAIPIIGHALGIAMAAAAVAFGAERIGQVTSAADGGLITGGTPGKDSVPALLMPGELVVPKRSFNDVVGAVQGTSTGMNSQENTDILKSIESKLSNPQQTIIQGDVLTDDSYVDTLIRKISDALEFRNARLYGVTT